MFEHLRQGQFQLTQASFKFPAFLLPWPLMCWDQRHELPCPATETIFICSLHSGVLVDLLSVCAEKLESWGSETPDVSLVHSSEVPHSPHTPLLEAPTALTPPCLSTGAAPVADLCLLQQSVALW